MCVTRGANVFLVARSVDGLTDVADELNAETPRTAFPPDTPTYPADITDESTFRRSSSRSSPETRPRGCPRQQRRTVDPSVDALNSVDRSHDYQRTMAVNYFGAVYLTLALLPHMVARQAGHIVNVSSVAVQSHGPRFGAYGASKAALGRSATRRPPGLCPTTSRSAPSRLPLTRTKMIAPTDARLSTASGVSTRPRAGYSTDHSTSPNA